MTLFITLLWTTTMNVTIATCTMTFLCSEHNSIILGLPLFTSLVTVGLLLLPLLLVLFDRSPNPFPGLRCARTSFDSDAAASVKPQIGHAQDSDYSVSSSYLARLRLGRRPAAAAAQGIKCFKNSRKAQTTTVTTSPESQDQKSLWVPHEGSAVATPSPATGSLEHGLCFGMHEGLITASSSARLPFSRRQIRQSALLSDDARRLHPTAKLIGKRGF